MKTFTTTALGLAALIGAFPGPAGAQSADEDAELLATPASDSGMSLKLSGFADFRYVRFWSNRDVRWQLRGIPEHGAFSVGNLNLYLDGRLDQSFRSLIEVRFSYLPNGVALQGATDKSTGTGIYTGTLTYDYAQLRAKAQWGGVLIERAWLEYRLDQALTLRAGHFLTPYGVWNVDHGSPTLVDAAPPFPIGQELLPKSQVGIEAYGSVFLGDARLGYHLTVSNGRIGNNPQYLNFDTNFGVGGRMFVEAGWAGELKVGASAYGGRMTERRQGLDYVTPPAVQVPMFLPRNTITRGKELGLAADIRWDLWGFTLIAEYIEQRLSDESQEVQQVLNNDGAVQTISLRNQPDFTKRGWYALLGYRLPGAVTPFAQIQYINDSRGDFLHDELQEAYAYTGGVNWRIRPNVVAKAAYTYARWPRTPETLENKDPLKWLATQVAWAF